MVKTKTFRTTRRHYMLHGTALRHYKAKKTGIKDAGFKIP